MLDKSTYESDEFLQYYNDLSTNKEKASIETREYSLDFKKKAKDIADMFNQNTYSMSKDATEQIASSAHLNKESKMFWDLLQEDDDQQLIIKLLTDDNLFIKQRDSNGREIKTFLDKDLDKLVSEYLYDSGVSRSKIELWSDRLGESYGTSPLDFFHSARTNETAKLGDIFRKRIEREAILRQGWNGRTGADLDIDYDEINKFVESVALDED